MGRADGELLPAKMLQNHVACKLSRHSRFQTGICFNYRARGCATPCFPWMFFWLNWKPDGKRGVRREWERESREKWPWRTAFTADETNQLQINAMCSKRMQSLCSGFGVTRRGAARRSLTLLRGNMKKYLKILVFKFHVDTLKSLGHKWRVFLYCRRTFFPELACMLLRSFQAQAELHRRKSAN